MMNGLEPEDYGSICWEQECNKCLKFIFHECEGKKGSLVGECKKRDLIYRHPREIIDEKIQVFCPDCGWNYIAPAVISECRTCNSKNIEKKFIKEWEI